MTGEEREAAIAYIKGYRKLDEDLHNTAPKDSISYYATEKCLKYWDMAIRALEQEPWSERLILWQNILSFVTIAVLIWQKWRVKNEQSKIQTR